MTAENKPFQMFGLLVRHWTAGDAALNSERLARTRDRIKWRATSLAQKLRRAGGEANDIMRSVEATQNHLAHPRSTVRLAAMHMLINYWKLDDATVRPIVLGLLNDPAPEVRKDALESIGIMFRKSKDLQIANTLAKIVVDTMESIVLRRSAYTSLRDVLGLSVFRYGLPSNLRIPEQVDWNLIGSCLRHESFSVSDERDRTFDERIERMGSPELRASLRSFACAKYAFQAGDYGEAITRCTESLVVYPNSSGCLYLRACAFGNIGDLCAAIADFSAAIASNPDQPVYYRERSEAYRRLGLVDAAQADADIAFQLEQRCR